MRGAGPHCIHSMGTPGVVKGVFREEGVSQSIVKCILQDKKGFIYFGTEDGLNRYDGYSFKLDKDFSTPSSISNGDMGVMI